MKKVIDRKVYNTEKAEEVCVWENGYDVNSLHYCSETLYRTKKGSWFVFGEGGGLSRYGTMASYGPEIKPLDEDGALYWLEKNGKESLFDIEEIITKHFEDVLEDA